MNIDEIKAYHKQGKVEHGRYKELLQWGYKALPLNKDTRGWKDVALWKLAYAREQLEEAHRNLMNFSSLIFSIGDELGCAKPTKGRLRKYVLEARKVSTETLRLLDKVSWLTRYNPNNYHPTHMGRYDEPNIVINRLTTGE